MRAGAWAVAAILALSVIPRAYADQADDMPDQLKRCLQESDVVELRACLRFMGEMVMQQDRERLETRAAIRDCMGEPYVESMKVCLSFLVKEKEGKKRKEGAIEAALRTWVVTREESRMDGSSRVLLSLESDDDIQVGYGLHRRPVLHLRCMDGVTSASVASQWFLGEGIPVRWRVDQEKPVAQTWGRSHDGLAAGLWQARSAVPFVKALLGKSTLVMRIGTFHDGTKEMAFDIAGLDGVIGPLREACKW
jgi:type VI secretion system VasI family protein